MDFINYTFERISFKNFQISPENWIFDSFERLDFCPEYCPRYRYVAFALKDRLSSALRDKRNTPKVLHTCRSFWNQSLNFFEKKIFKSFFWHARNFYSRHSKCYFPKLRWVFHFSMSLNFFYTSYDHIIKNASAHNVKLLPAQTVWS